MDKREGVKGRRPEFCASCSKAMMSYITTVKDFLDKVVEDIDINTPSSRREEGVLARTRIAAEVPVRDSSDVRRRSAPSTEGRRINGQVHQVITSATQPAANQPLAKVNSTICDEKKDDELNAKFTLGKTENAQERYPSRFKARSHIAQDKILRSPDVQRTEIVSATSLQPSHTQPPLQDTHSSNSVPHEQQPEPHKIYPSEALPIIDDSSKQSLSTLSNIDFSSSHSPPSSPIVDHSSSHSPPSSPIVDPSSNHLDLPIVDHLLNDQPLDNFSNGKSKIQFADSSLVHRALNNNEMTPPVQLPQSKAIVKEPTTSYEHPPALYSDHLSPPVQPEQAPLPIEEPSLPDGPFPTTWVEDMIRVCDIPLLLPPNEDREAYVTMATNNLTAIGCLVLGNSLRLSGTVRTLAVLITDNITEEIRNLLASIFHLVQPVSSLEPTGSTKLALLEQPELGINYSKLLVWRLNQFDKCVFLSPDTLVVQNCDELFQRNELSAVPDIGWPDFFNAGVFVYVPSDATFWDLMSFAENKGSFDGGDQGLLNFYFRSWTLDINKRLPFIYNLMANVSYTYGPAFVKYGGNAKIVHFFGTTKPWNVQFNVRTGQLAPYSGVHPTFSRYVQYWLTIFAQCVLPLFSPDIQQYTTMHGYVNAVDLARIVTGQAESAITFSPPSFRRYLDVPETVAFPAEKVQSTLLRRLSIDEEPPSEEEEEDIYEEEKKEEDKEAEALADFNRMQAWEQGRIDYMGEDSSDKIMKRLDRFIKKGSRLS